MAKAEETVLEIDLNALEYNFRFFASKAGKGIKMMGVVKASGYGSEVIAVAKKLEELGAEYLAVAFPSEGIVLREAGIKLPILVFHPQPIHFDSIIEHCLEPSLFSPRQLTEFIKTAEARNLKAYPIHIKLNTGMNRLGFSEEETDFLTETLAESKSVRAASVFSHFVASEDWREREFSLQQIYTFRRIALKIHESLDYEPLLHICNTSGVINYPEATFDMVRVGIGLYGYANDKRIDKELKPVATLKTVISQIHELEQGESVGYNRAFIAEAPMRSATLPLGYGDGISRKYGNGRAGVFINGKFAPIIGNVCMDMIMVNVTDIECLEGDEVIVFGEGQPASIFAEVGETISYELLTGVSQRVKRILK